MPLLNGAIYAALIAAARESAGAYAQTPAGIEPLVAVLSPDVRPHLLEALSGTPPRTHVALDRAGVRAVRFDDAAPFANVNTPDDLARLALVKRAR
jgi:molybdopterin-guanine dinucleotide biosynthesis protein A